MYEGNLRRIEKRIEAGLKLLRENYEVRELPVRNIFKSFMVADRRHVVRQFQIVGVGNLLVMTNPDDGSMQMDTFTITPYYKNLPLFTTDYMYFENHMSFLNEIYSLVEYEDDIYQEYIGQFRRNGAKVSHLDDMNLPPCWYDEIRPVVTAKNASYDKEDLAFHLFLNNLSTFIQMEKSLPRLEGEHLQEKWNRNYEYARALVEDGGVSTELFVKSLGADETKEFFYSIFFAPARYMGEPINQLVEFFDQTDEEGVTNLEKVGKNQKIIRRDASTDKNKSYEEVKKTGEGYLPSGIVVEDGKAAGFGIHIFNEDIYPIQSFEITLRNCGLTGALNLAGCKDMKYVDVYYNRIEKVVTGDLPSMRIFGIQHNLISILDVTKMPSCQGIDAGFNKLSELDISKNEELVELYINDNDFREIDLSCNEKLKYFYCQNNRIEELNTRKNKELRHLNATGNPLKKVLSHAPQREELLPLEVYAQGNGYIGLKFNPVYNAQWKETGEWEQCYYAYPMEGAMFKGWYENDGLVSQDEVWIDTYGNSRVIEARFE